MTHAASCPSADEPTGRVAGLVLAAGRATRFGATKQLAHLHGRPLVAHAVAAAIEAGLAPVVVVTGHDGRRVADAARAAGPVEVVHDPSHAEAQSRSLRAGVAVLRDRSVDGTVVLLADEPAVPVAAVRGVADQLRQGALLARARYDDGSGHPVGLHREVFARVLAEVDGDQGARTLLQRGPVVAVPVAGPRPRDVDRPGDLPASR